MNQSRTISFISGPLLTLLTLTVLSGCGAPDGNPLDGKKWYNMHNCSSCHGPNGDDGRAPHISGTDMWFSSFVKRLRTSGDSIMPAYPEELISKQDAADIYAYLQSMQK
jgi:mono/diheme cytochrome c family protein